MIIFVKVIQFLTQPHKKFVAYICTYKVIVNKTPPIVIFTYTHANVLLINDWNSLSRY